MSQSIAVKSYTPLALKTGSEQIIFPPVITLKGDNGQYASRIHRTTDSIEFAKPEVDQHCYFRVHQLPGNKIALKADNGCWVSRFFRDDCHRIEAVKTEIDIYCQFQVFQGKENEIYLKADNGYFLSRMHRGFEYVEAAKAVIDKHCLLIVGEPLLKKEILNVDYKLNEAEITNLDALACLNTTIRNEGGADVTQTLQYTYSKSEVGTWNNSAGIEIGVSTAFKAGVPLLAEGKIEVSVNASYTHEWGGSSGTEKNISSSTQVVVPSKTEGKAKVLIRRAIIDIPFTYKVRRTFLSGMVEEQTIKTGKYQNVESYFVDVQTYDFKKL